MNNYKVNEFPLVTNRAGGQAYLNSAENALAQYAMTGCLNGTYYASEKDQTEKVLELGRSVKPTFLAQVAVYARVSGRMKEMPALLLALLASLKTEESRQLLASVFPTVIDDLKMLRNFVRHSRSGVTGRKSFGTAVKRELKQWLEQRTPEQLFRQSVGDSPSLSDVLAMVHPMPNSEESRALFGWLRKREVEHSALPALAREVIEFRKDQSLPLPKVPFEMLTSLPLGPEHWKEIARNASWKQTRMNLNLFLRKGVFEDESLVQLLAERLRDREQILRAGVFPYQLLKAFQMAEAEMPFPLREALQDAMEVATESVPVLEGNVVLCPDVSLSMHSPVTGNRGGATSTVRCIDVAALVAAAFVRRNPSAQVIPFECGVVDVELNPRDSVMTNATVLAEIGGGGTDCSAPLRMLNAQGAKVDVIVFISDNESWIGRGYKATPLREAWAVLKARNPQARMVCIDIQPSETVQAQADPDILNVGGFSDEVFSVIADFTQGSSESWAEKVRTVKV